MLNSINNLKKHSFLKLILAKRETNCRFLAPFSTLSGTTTQFSQKFLKCFAETVTIHGYFYFNKHGNRWQFEFRLSVDRDSYFFLYMVQELLGDCGSIDVQGNKSYLRIVRKSDINDIILPILKDNPFLTGDAKKKFEVFRLANLVWSDKKLHLYQKDLIISDMKTEFNKIGAKTKD